MSNGSYGHQDTPDIGHHVLADSLAPNGARPSASTVLTNIHTQEGKGLQMKHRQ